MIPADAHLVVQWVSLDDIRFDDQDIDHRKVAYYATLLEADGGEAHLAPPILNANLTIRDGRHRLLSHRIAGRHRARCLIVHQRR
jgi:hypothetical protein